MKDVIGSASGNRLRTEQQYRRIQSKPSIIGYRPALCRVGHDGWASVAGGVIYIPALEWIWVVSAVWGALAGVLLHKAFTGGGRFPLLYPYPDDGPEYHRQVAPQWVAGRCESEPESNTDTNQT